MLFIGVHVEVAALALAAGPHPTRILGPPQQCLPYLLHPCLHTHQLQIEGRASGWQNWQVHGAVVQVNKQSRKCL